MILALLLVAALTGLTGYLDGRPTLLVTAVKFHSDCKPSTLRYVYAFFRHGIRAPNYKPYPNDPNKSKYHKYFPGPPGELTKIGKKVMYQVGKNLKIRYGDFVGEYLDEKVHVSTTATSRTTMTALTVMAGFLPPSKPLFKDLRWQPVPVWQNTTDFDKVVYYNDPNIPELALKECPAYGRLIQQGYETISDPDTTPDRQTMYKLVQNYTGKADVNSVNTLYEVWDTLQFESKNGLPLPAWATQPQPQYQNKPLYPDVMEPTFLDWFRDLEYLNNNDNMLFFFSGPLFNSIHEHFLMKSQYPHWPEKFRYHNTHDDTLYVFLWSLKLSEPVTVGPGDGILFELHEHNNTFVVKVFYYDTTHNHNIREMSLPLCPPPCTLENFIKATPGLTPEEWQKKCGK